MGVELRAFSIRELAVGAQLTLDVRRPEDAVVVIGGPPHVDGPPGIPEPRTTELLGLL